MNQILPRFRNLFTPPPLPLPRERFRPRIGRRAERGDLAELLRTRRHMLAQIGCGDDFETPLPSTTSASPALLDDVLPDAAESLAESLAQLPLFADDNPEIEVCYLDEIDLQDAPTWRLRRGDVIAIALTEAYQQARDDPDLIIRPEPPIVAPAEALELADTVVGLEEELADAELELSDDELEIQEPESFDDGELEIQEVEVDLDFEDLSLIEEALDAAAVAHAAESVSWRLPAAPRSTAVAEETVAELSAEACCDTAGDLSSAIFSALQVAVSRCLDGGIEVRPLALGQELPEGARLALLLPGSPAEGAELLKLFGSAC